MTIFFLTYVNGTVDGNDEVVVTVDRLYSVAMLYMQLDEVLAPVVLPNR